MRRTRRSVASRRVSRASWRASTSRPTRPISIRAITAVRRRPGEGEIGVNGRSLDEHFGNAVNEAEVRMPFRVTGTEGRYNAMIKVEGGGVTGQAGAIRHGIARALLQLDPEANRLPLRQAGLLTRDPRMKERKKYGLKRARKAPQYTKR